MSLHTHIVSHRPHPGHAASNGNGLVLRSRRGDKATQLDNPLEGLNIEIKPQSPGTFDFPEFACQFAVRTLDDVLRGITRNPEHFVVVLEFHDRSPIEYQPA
jgi:hypothetical protein